MVMSETRESSEIERESTARSCIKCGQTAAVSGSDISSQAFYCRQCFLQMLVHKFRKSLGANRVFREFGDKPMLVVYDGTHQALTLLDMIKRGQAEPAAKRLSGQPHVLCILSDTHPDIQTQVQSIHNMYKQWSWTIMPLCSIYSTQSIDIDSINANSNRFHQLLQSITDSSMRAQLISLFRVFLTYQVAQQNNCSRILTPCNANVLAERALNCMCLGRGTQLHWDTAIVDNRHTQSWMIRPLRDVSTRDCALYNTFTHGDDAVVVHAADESSTPNMQSVTSNLVQSLASKQASTVPTLLKTADKVHALDTGEDDRACGLCYTPHSNTTGSLCTPCTTMMNVHVPDTSLLPHLIKALL